MSDWRFEERVCPICGDDRRQILGRRGGLAHHQGLGIPSTIVRCRHCHGVYQSPTALPIGNPYLSHDPQEYFEHHSSAGKIKAGERLAATAARLAGGPGRMLELGCGRAELLKGAADAGWTVRGVDMTATFAGVARALHGVDVEVSPVETARALNERWDAIVLAAILEHVYEPTALLRRVSQALRPGGVVFLDVPNECSLYTRVGNAYHRARGRDWAVNLSPTFSPYHVVGFCPSSLAMALGLADLFVVELRQYRMRSCLKRCRIERLGVDLVLSVGQWIGMGAGITCWARRTARP